MWKLTPPKWLTPFCLLQWFGEGEKYVKAVFSLASKIAPSVVFVDEVGTTICVLQFQLLNRWPTIVLYVKTLVED